MGWGSGRPSAILLEIGLTGRADPLRCRLSNLRKGQL